MPSPERAADFFIRETLPADRPAVVSMVERSENLSGEEKDCAVELVDIYLSHSGQKDYFFLTAVDEGLPAGYVCYGPRPLASGVFDLYWAVVAPESRGRGVAKRLISHAEGVLKAGGARMLVAETSGLPSYDAARRLYHACGFAEEARVKGFYKPGDDLIVFVKRF